MGLAARRWMMISKTMDAVGALCVLGLSSGYQDLAGTDGQLPKAQIYPMKPQGT